MNILKKLLLVIILLTVIPMFFLGHFTYNGINEIKYSSEANIIQMNDLAVEDSITALNEMGITCIKEQAEHVASRIESYLIENPDMNLDDLREDAHFQDMAIQSVGETGYTLVGDYDNLVVLFHKYPEYVDYDIRDFQEVNPSLWEIASKVEGGRISQGFHELKDPDGSIREKYAYMYPVDVRTADDVGLFVASTTYLDEFNKPAEMTARKLNEKSEQTIAYIESARINIQNTMLSAMFLFTIISLTVAILLSNAISTPIKKLKDSAKQVGKGRLDKQIKADSNDEIGDLARSFDNMRVELKDRSDLLNSLLKTFRGKFGNLATILVRKDVQELIKQNPRIKKIVPKLASNAIVDTVGDEKNGKKRSKRKKR